jgi:hypothetical protein
MSRRTDTTIMQGTISAEEAAFLIQRLAEALATGDKRIAIRIDQHDNLWVGDRCAATIRDEVTA